MNPLDRRRLRGATIIAVFEEGRETVGRIGFVHNRGKSVRINWTEAQGGSHATVFQFTEWDSRVAGKVTFLYRTVDDGSDGADRFMLIQP